MESSEWSIEVFNSERSFLLNTALAVRKKSFILFLSLKEFGDISWGFENVRIWFNLWIATVWFEVCHFIIRTLKFWLSLLKNGHFVIDMS